MRTRLLLFIAAAPSLLAQFAITSPTASQSISGTSFTFTVASVPATTYSNECKVNGETAGISYTAPWSVPWNPYYSYGGAYTTVQCIARDALNTTLATTASVAFTVANSLPLASSVLAGTISAPGATLTGFGTMTWTPTGTDAASAQLVYFVDGKQLPTSSFNSEMFNNGVHNVVSVLMDSVAGLGTNSGWNAVAQWEKQITFSNGSAVMELRTNASEVFLCTTTLTNCPTSYTLSGTVYNVDETTTSSSASVFISSDTAVATVTSGGLISKVGSTVGSTTVKMGARIWSGTDGVLHNNDSLASASHNFTRIGDYIQITNTGDGGTCTPGIYFVTGLQGGNTWGTIGTGICTNGETGIAWNSGPARTVWVHVNTQNVLPHFGTDGSRLTAYDPTKSIFAQMLYQSYDFAFNSGNYPSAFTYGGDMVEAGLNAVSSGCSVPQQFQSSYNQASYESRQTALTTGISAAIAPYNIYWFCTGDGMARGTDNVYLSTQGPGSAWTPKSAVTYAFDSLKNKRMLGALMNDEVNFTWAAVPKPGQLVWGNSLMATSIICVNGGNCTVNMNREIIAAAGGGFEFLILGATTNSCLNTSGTTATTRAVNGFTGQTSFTFTNPCSGSFTATSSTDPGLNIEPFVAYWVDADGNQCSSNCTRYVRYDAFASIMAQANLISGRPAITWEVASGYDALAVSSWMGDPTMADFSVMFYQGANCCYIPQYTNLYDLVSTNGFTYRDKYRSLGTNRLSPVMGEAAAVNTNYGMQGYSIAITSIADDLVTFAAPHQLYNILPWVSRLYITGSSNSLYNGASGVFYVRDCPTATTCHIVWSHARFAVSTIIANNTATAHFADASTYTVYAFDASDTNDYATFLTINNDTGCTMPNKRGQLVTFTETSVSIGSFASKTFWYIPTPMNGTTCNSQALLAEIPVGSSTGGTAIIIPDSKYVRGRNYPGPSNNERGGRYSFVSNLYQMMLGASANLIYVVGDGGRFIDDPTLRNHTNIWGDPNSQNIQAGPQIRYDYGGGQIAWQANAMAALLTKRLAKFILQPRIPAPDYGQFVESSLRTGSYGKIAMALSLADGSVTRTADLSACVVTGQPTIKYVAGWKGITVTSINAGTTTDTANFDPDSGAFIAYVCANNAAAEYSPPTISVRLADVANAAKVAVQYNYNSFWFATPLLQSLSLPAVLDGGIGTFTLPVDRNIAPTYYRLLFLNSSNAVLATSDVQILR